MVRKSLAVASVLGSTALALAAFATATPATASPAAAPAAPAAQASTGNAVVTTRHHVSTFDMVRSGNSVATNCLPKAKAKVYITSKGPVEKMHVVATGLPKKTDFDFFVIQVPDAKFGLSWYQGDLESNKYGNARGTFVGRFNEETFIVAPGVAPAPVLHTSPFKDAASNPVTAPVHTFHLGFWFNSPKDAAKAGCGNAVTPFNGEHNAGPQAMSTRNFAPGNGPLGQIGS
jgi:hypothetical protein